MRVLWGSTGPYRTNQMWLRSEQRGRVFDEQCELDSVALERPFRNLAWSGLAPWLSRALQTGVEQLHS